MKIRALPNAMIVGMMSACGGNVREQLGTDGPLDASVESSTRDVGTGGNARGPACSSDDVCQVWSSAAYCLGGKCCIGDSDPSDPQNCICGNSERGCEFLDVCCNVDVLGSPSRICTLAATATQFCK